MLVLLWLFQIVFLESFYKSIKIKEIESSAESIVENIDNEDLQALVENISQQNDLCIKVTDELGTTLYSAEYLPDCMIHHMPPFEFIRLKGIAEKNGGIVFERYQRDGALDGREGKRQFIGRVLPPDLGITETMIYGKLVSAKDGSQYFILLNSVITPVSSTVYTLRVQLVYITVIMLILAFAIALLLSKKIAKPIIKMNASAKELAKGNFDATFEVKGYFEISELNDTLSYAAKELAKVEKLRRELIANISHDLRTPLTMITGYAEAICDLPGENTVENVQIIIDEAKHLTNLVNDMLDISKLQSGTQVITISEFNLTESIRDIQNRFTKLTLQDGYTIDFRYDSDIFVQADEMRISQVIYNLINNAITYGGSDKIVTVLQKLYNGFVRVEIIDNGEGIPEDKLPYIWDRYYKLDKAHKRNAVGTGLGLSIVKSILALHGAWYGVQSTLGKGSIFWFELNI